MSKTIDKQLLEHILIDRITSYVKMNRKLDRDDKDDYEYHKIYKERINTMFHVIEILYDTNKWIRNMGDAKLEELGLNIEDYE